jgi:hypothetical protein
MTSSDAQRRADEHAQVVRDVASMRALDGGELLIVRRLFGPALREVRASRAPTRKARPTRRRAVDVSGGS